MTAAASSAAPIEALTTHGPVVGADLGVVRSFRGIPYGAPTSGDGRFAPPRPPEPWTEPRPCTTDGQAAPQNPSILETSLGSASLEVGEDCLWLNVFSPDLDGSAPVMVWFHGGGFETGTPSMTWYDGTRLTERGVVVVTVAYRLGVTGYLHLPGEPGSGCWGLMDQIAALGWVRDNAAAFGGDPGRVTVFGESAGAMSIGALMAAPGAQGLFHRAILQSGAAHNVHSEAYAAKVASRLCEAAGVAEGDVDGLRSLPLDELLVAQSSIGRGDDGTFGLPWQPVVGSDEVPRRPIDALREGAAAGVDVLVGTTLEEMRLFPLIDPRLAQVDDSALRARTTAYERLMGRDEGSMLEAYARTEAMGSPERWLDLLTDLVFRIPAIRLAEAQVAAGATARMYLFAEASDHLGSCHALDIPFAFDNLDQPGTEILIGQITDERRELARRVGDAWTAFAAGAEDPAPDDVGEWPAYDAERRATLWIRAGEVKVVDDPMRAEREWWHGLEGGLDGAFDVPL